MDRNFLKIGLLSLGLTACVARLPPIDQSVSPTRAAVVFYGLGEGAFSDGMKDAADKAGTIVQSWSVRLSLQEDLINAHEAGDFDFVVIAGHSLGGNAALGLANALAGADVPVRCVVTLDPTVNHEVAPEVGYAVNFVSRDIRAKYVSGAENRLRPELSHIQMDNDPKIQETMHQCLTSPR